MNFQHLKYFQVVAKEENYFRASQKLFITQSALSRAIANLEDELGVELFEKTGRNIRITPVALKFLEYIDEALNIIDQGVEEIHLMTGRMDGTITLSTCYGFTYKYLPDLMSQFNELYPDIHFILKPSTTLDVIQQVHLGESDIGFHSDTYAIDKYPNLDFYQIHKEELVIIVPPTHPLAERDSVFLSEIVNERIISFDGTSGIFYQTKRLFQEAGLEFHPFITVSDDQSIINLVSGGMAIAVMQKNIGISSNNFKMLTINDNINKYMDTYLCIKRKQSYTPSVKHFLEFSLSKANKFN